MALTTKEAVKTVLGITGTGHDDLIDLIIDEASVAFAGYCRRFDANAGASLLERREDRVEYPEGGRTYLAMACYPIESVSEIKQAIDRDFDATDALAEGEDFWVDTNAGGKIVRLPDGNQFYAGPGVVRVTYTGGYFTGSIEDPEHPLLAIPLPDDLRWAATMQAKHVFQHREKFGEQTISVGNTTFTQIVHGLLDDVKKTLDRYTFMG